MSEEEQLQSAVRHVTSLNGVLTSTKNQQAYAQITEKTVEVQGLSPINQHDSVTVQETTGVDRKPLVTRFHQKCAEKMDPKDLKWQNLSDATRKQLEMSDKEFDENLLASSLAMQIIRRSSGNENAGTQQEPSKNQQSPIENQQKPSNIQLSTSKDPKMSGNTQKPMAGNQESNVRIQQEAATSQEKSPVDQISPEKVPNMNTESIDSTKHLFEVQHGTGNVADTALDLIAQLLSERLKMVETHRKEYLEAVNSFDNLALIAWMEHQRKQQVDERERHMKMVSEFAADRTKRFYKSRYTHEETSIILGKLRNELRSYLEFYWSCLSDYDDKWIRSEEERITEELLMNEENFEIRSYLEFYLCRLTEFDDEWIESKKEEIRKELQMNEKEFDANVVSSTNILSILDTYSPSARFNSSLGGNHVPPPVLNVRTFRKTRNWKRTAQNPQLNDNQPFVENSSSMTQGSLVEVER